MGVEAVLLPPCPWWKWGGKELARELPGIVAELRNVV